jgi:4-nitrophenyl phosphatase
MEGAVLDVDGTVLRGDRMLEGALKGTDTLRDGGVRLVFFSNNPTVTSDGLAGRLRDAGVEVGDAVPLTSATLTAVHVEENCAPPVHVTGEGAVAEALRSHGVDVTNSPSDARTAVVSVDRDLRYADLREAVDAATGADDYVCTDPDAVVPTGDGDIPGTGAVEAAVSRAAGREPLVVGKPSETAARAALDALGTSPEDTVFVGDRLDTDIALGERVGSRTALVRTGVTSDADLSSSEHRPDAVLDTLADVSDLL